MTSFKLFDFYGIPVYLKIWFLLLFTFTTPMFVLTIFISILIHELAHAWIGNHLGYNVKSVNINFMGGSADIDIINMSERDTIRVVAAGPLSNLFLYGLSLLLISFFGSNDFLLKMVVTNMLLFLFNILPIYPMDGGRLLRSYLTIFTKNKDKSIRIGAYVSIVLSIGLLVLSILTISIFMGIFSCLFIYLALKDLKIIN